MQATQIKDHVPSSWVITARATLSVKRILDKAYAPCRLSCVPDDLGRRGQAAFAAGGHPGRVVDKCNKFRTCPDTPPGNRPSAKRGQRPQVVGASPFT